MMQFRFSIAQHLGVFAMKGDIAQVVEIRKDGDLGEFGDSSDDEKGNVGVAPLGHRIKIFEDFPVLSGLIYVFNMVDNRFVIFINENGDLFFFGQRLNQFFEL